MSVKKTKSSMQAHWIFIKVEKLTMGFTSINVLNVSVLNVTPMLLKDVC